MKKRTSIRKILSLLLLSSLLLTTACGGTQNTVTADKAQTQADAASATEADADSQSSEATDQQTNTANGNGETENQPDAALSQDSMEVHFIDIGQGDATLIKCGDHAMLIDAGENDMGTKVQLYLQKQGVKALDYVIGTHPDSDHIGGLDVILYKFACDTIMMPEYAKDTRTYEDVIQAMKSKGYQNTAPIVGNEYTLGEAVFTILAPNNYNYGNNSNNYSIALLLKHGENTFLFTGDAEEEAETDMLANGLNLAADVYQAGHHGSATASSQAFLDAVQPSYAVISCGEDNSYGHPHAETLNKFRAMGIQVFRTDEQGSIIATSDGITITWNAAPSDTWKAGEKVKNNATDTQAEASTPTGKDDTKTTQQNQSQTVTEPPTVVDTPATPSIANTYICNTNTKKFHYPSCASVSQMKEENKQEVTTTHDDLVSMGYSPCKKCNP